MNFNILIYIILTVLVFIKFYTNSVGLLLRLMESNRSLIILIMEITHIFQYGAIFKKMTFSNINLQNKVHLLVVLKFLKVKIRKAFCCNIVSLEDLLKLNYLCQLIRKFSNFSWFYLFGDFFFVCVCVCSYETRVCSLILHCIIYTSYSNNFFVSQFILGLRKR